MDFQKIIKIVQGIHVDGGLTREEWKEILPIIIRLLENIHLDIDTKPLLYVAIKGCVKTLEILLGDLQNENR